ncbi:MAG: SulP family inorganic anion transporter [Acidimicrobiia bacterium]|nr:SulP family inorganic anion transporter [Acidimicrobiia bacterium]
MRAPRQGFSSQDLLSSVVVFLVALPLCLGIAIASGVPPAMGLISGIIGGLVVGLLAGSPLQVSGPAAGLAVLVYEIVQTHGVKGLGLIVFLAGLLQIGAGLLKMGQWFRAMSPAVIYGMLAGIGVLIFGSQFHVMVDDAPRENGIRNLLAIPEALMKSMGPGTAHQTAALLGIVTIATLMAWNAFAPKRVRWVPGALVAVVLAAIVSAVTGANIRFVELPDSLFASVSPLSTGHLGLLTGPVLISVFTLAFVASAETLLSASAVDRMQDGPRTNYDRELVAQGVGNSIAGFLGALPITGVIVRSAANVNAGARSRYSAIMHGGWLLLFVIAFPGLLRMVPTSSLAAVLVYTGYRLVDPASLRRLAAYGTMPVVIYFVTLIMIVSTDLLTGIVAGFVLSAVQVLYRLTRFDIRVQQDETALHVHLDGTGTFMRLPKLLSTLESLPANLPVQVHVHLRYLDDAVMETLASWQKQRRMQGSEVEVQWDRVIGLYREGHKADEGRLRKFVQHEAPAAH